MATIYYNGSIITMENEADCPEAVLVAEGVIAKVGSLSEIKSTAPSDVEEVDLQGKTLLPGFIDPHGHLSLAGQMITACDLSECETFEEIISTLKEYQAKNKFTPEDLIFGYGYDHNFLPNEEHPVKKYLNQVSTEIPICILHTSAHMGCANDKLLEIAGITAQTQDPQGGCFGRVDDTQEPDGYLEENAMFSAMGLMKTRIKFDVFENMEKAQLKYMSQGITTAQDGASNTDTLNMFKMLAMQEKLMIDVVAYPIVEAPKEDGTRETPFETFSEFANKYTNKFKIGGYKSVLDGSPQGKSAWLTQPYENSDGYCAYSWFKDEQVEEFMSIAIAESQQILVHCNGDAAGDQFLSSYVKAYEKSDNPDKAKLRPVMIHCQTAREDQLDIMQKYEIIPSIFIGHVYFWGDVHVKNLGQARGERVSPVQSAFKRGLVVNFHEDPPVTPARPLFSLWTAVNRTTRGGVVLAPEQRCSVYDGLKAITINGAYAYFEEDSKGSIKEGKRADLVILDQNPLTVDITKIKDIKVLETIKDGKSYKW